MTPTERQRLVEEIAALIDPPPWNAITTVAASPGYGEELAGRKLASLDTANAILRLLDANRPVANTGE